MATQGPETKTVTGILFPQPARFAESLTWLPRDFTLPTNPKHRIKTNRVIVGTSNCNDGCKVYITADLDVEVLSQREIETGIRVNDQPAAPGQTRITRTRYLSLQQPRVRIGEDLTIDLIEKVDGVISFRLRAPDYRIPERIYSTRSFNDYPV